MVRGLIITTVVTAALLASLVAQAQTTNKLYLPAISDSRPTALSTATSTTTRTTVATATTTTTRTAASTATSTTTKTVTHTATATSTATSTPTPTLEPVFGTCETDPNPAAAPNAPVRIMTVFKSASPEVVRLENMSAGPVSLNGWQICSITGNQTHGFVFDIDDVLTPGEIRDVPHQGLSPIWNNDSRDDAALYDNAGRLISYWIDE